jgi:hypothetical protein
LPNELPKRPRGTSKQLGVTVPHRGKSGTVKNKVVFITHSGTTHITHALKTRKPLPAAHINGKAMNTKTKPEKEPNLGNIKR